MTGQAIGKLNRYSGTVGETQRTRKGNMGRKLPVHGSGSGVVESSLFILRSGLLCTCYRTQTYTGGYQER